MPQIPDGTYHVTILGENLDTWASGDLVVSTDAYNNRSMTYAGQPTDKNDYDTTDVGWRVTLTGPNSASCVVTFNKGNYANGSITGGKATSPCFRRPTHDLEDAWSASTSQAGATCA